MENLINNAILANKSEVKVSTTQKIINLPAPQTAGTTSQGVTYASQTSNKIAEQATKYFAKGNTIFDYETNFKF